MGEPGVKGEKGKPMNIEEFKGTNFTVITVKVGDYLLCFLNCNLKIDNLKIEEHLMKNC